MPMFYICEASLTFQNIPETFVEHRIEKQNKQAKKEKQKQEQNNNKAVQKTKKQTNKRNMYNSI